MDRTDLAPLLNSTDREYGPYLRALAACALYGWVGCTRSERRRLAAGGARNMSKSEAADACRRELTR